MRRQGFGGFLTLFSCIVFGLAAMYVSYFHTGSVCDQSGGCTIHHAGTIEPVFFFGGALFFLVGVFGLVTALRKRTPKG